MLIKVLLTNPDCSLDQKSYLAALLPTLGLFALFFHTPYLSGAEIFVEIVPMVGNFATNESITADALVFSQKRVPAAGLDEINADTNPKDGSASILPDSIFFEPFNLNLSPTFGFKDEPPPTMQRSVTSRSPAPIPMLLEISVAFAEAGFRPPTPTVPGNENDPCQSRFKTFGEASTQKKKPGPFSSAGLPSNRRSGQRGRWPGAVTVGEEVQLNPTICEVRLEFGGLSTETESAGVMIFGEVGDGSDFRRIWEAIIIADKELLDSSDLMIDFRSDPSLMLDDESVKTQLKDAFSVVDGKATLSNHELFSTTYTFTEPQFGEGIVSVATAFPNLDPFKCYFGKQLPPFSEDNPQLLVPSIARVTLNDQFTSRVTDVRFLTGLCNPAGKNAPVNTARMDHLSCYWISDAPGQPLFFPPRQVTIETENFGEDTVRLGGALELCVSASKNGEGDIAGPAYKCYNATSAQRDFPDITLDDQFFMDEPTQVKRLSRFCTPVGKDEPAPAEDPESFDHLACYDIDRRFLRPLIDVDLLDMFIEDSVGREITFTTESTQRFCEPARKVSVGDLFFAVP